MCTGSGELLGGYLACHTRPQVPSRRSLNKRHTNQGAPSRGLLCFPPTQPLPPDSHPPVAATPRQLEIARRPVNFFSTCKCSSQFFHCCQKADRRPRFLCFLFLNYSWFYRPSVRSSARSSLWITPTDLPYSFAPTPRPSCTPGASRIGGAEHCPSSWIHSIEPSPSE